MVGVKQLVPAILLILAAIGCGDDGSESPAAPADTSLIPGPQVAIRAKARADVRAAAGAAHSKIGQIPEGDLYVAFSRSGSWWKVYFDGGYGYVLDRDMEIVPDSVALQVTAEALDVNDGQVFMAQIHCAAAAPVDGRVSIYWGGTTGLIPVAQTRSVVLSDGSAITPEESISLPLLHFYQATPWFCGPAAVEMMAAYLSGNHVTQADAAAHMGSSEAGGTPASGVAAGLSRFSGAPYWVADYSRESVVRNLDANFPVDAAMDTSYLAYWGFARTYHHSPVKGHTPGGFTIHDSSRGPDRWASDTELFNAEFYYANQTCVRM